MPETHESIQSASLSEIFALLSNYKPSDLEALRTQYPEKAALLRSTGAMGGDEENEPDLFIPPALAVDACLIGMDAAINSSQDAYEQISRPYQHLIIWQNV